MRLIRSRPIELNGSSQWLYIRLTPKAKGTLLFLHGGPGWADAPWAHVVCEKLWADFNIVHWDQRGSNRSYQKDFKTETLTIDQLVKDCISLVSYLKNELNLSKIFLVGHSWGSVLGALVVKKNSKNVSGLVGIGQFVSIPLSDRASLKYCLQKAQELGRRDLSKLLNKFSPDFFNDVEQLFRQRDILSQLYGDFSNAASRDTFRFAMNTAIPEYRALWDELGESCVRSVRKLWLELITVDLAKLVPRVDIPFLLLQGVHDHCTDTETAEKWFKKLKASKGKQAVWFDRSSHWPHFEENEKFAHTLKTWCMSSLPSL